jgi:hypothetical protein
MLPVRPKTLPFPAAALSGTGKPVILAQHDGLAPPRISTATPIPAAVSVPRAAAAIAMVEKL